MKPNRNYIPLFVLVLLYAAYFGYLTDRWFPEWDSSTIASFMPERFDLDIDVSDVHVPESVQVPCPFQKNSLELNSFQAEREMDRLIREDLHRAVDEMNRTLRCLKKAKVKAQKSNDTI